MNHFMALPPELRLAVLAAVGVAAGASINWAIYALAWFSRPISPWQRPHESAPPRSRLDRLPILGWLGLRREASLHGPGFWIRPLLLEIACGVGLPALYWWEINGHLTPFVFGVFAAPAAMLQHEFVSHALLIALMLVATFIDFDEKTIPDEITIPGTLLGLTLAALWPDSLLPVVRLIDSRLGDRGYGPLILTSTDSWPAWLDDWHGALLGAGIFAAWCIVLIPALCTLRRGWTKGIQYYFASAARGSAWWKMLLLGTVGSVSILAIWSRGGASWHSLLTALVGLAFGGGLIWGVRIVGTVALQKEAMGFGDVTLMAMIGSFLGWQSCVIVLFFSPFVALFVAGTQWLLTGRRDIAFGPYLCLGALITIVWWPPIWNYCHKVFEEGWLVPALLAACGVMLMGLLMLWRIIEQLLFGGTR